MFLRDKEILMKANQNQDYLNYLLQSKDAVKFIIHAIKSYTRSPARFMAVNKVEWDDLLQAGYIGLFKAIQNINFDLTPNEWVRYGYLMIQGELRNFSRSNNSNMLVISQRIREMYPKYIRFYEQFWKINQRDPSIQETMEHFLISKEDTFDLVYGMQDLIYQEKCTKTTTGSKDTNILEFYLSKSPSVEVQAINKILVELAMNLVNETQRKILYFHYFKGLSKSEISSIIGCSNSMITKHISVAFENIRKSRLCS